MADGTRTHDDQNHNLGLYQLSYSHRRAYDCSVKNRGFDGSNQWRGLKATFSPGRHWPARGHTLLNLDRAIGSLVRADQQSAGNSVFVQGIDDLVAAGSV